MGRGGVRRRAGGLVGGRRHPQRPARPPALGLAGAVHRAAARGLLARLASVRGRDGRLLVLPRARRRDLRRRPLRLHGALRPVAGRDRRRRPHARPSSCRTPGAATRASRAATRAGGTSCSTRSTPRTSTSRCCWALVLWVRHREAWRDWMRRYVTLLFVGLAGYFLVPTAPPWMGHRRRARITSRALARARPRAAEHDPARHAQPGRRDALAAHRHRRPGRVLGGQPAALTLALAAAALPGRDGRWRSATSASTTWSTRSRASLAAGAVMLGLGLVGPAVKNRRQPRRVETSSADAAG